MILCTLTISITHHVITYVHTDIIIIINAQYYTCISDTLFLIVDNSLSILYYNM